MNIRVSESIFDSTKARARQDEVVGGADDWHHPKNIPVQGEVRVNALW